MRNRTCLSSRTYELFIKMKMIPQIEASMIIRLESMKMKKYRCLSCELEYGIAPMLQLMGRVHYLNNPRMSEPFPAPLALLANVMCPRRHSRKIERI